jgi:hypothetical protein
MFGEEDGKPKLERVIISSLDRQLDNESKNKFTVRNFTNRFDELFSRITASVTSVETNEANWSKAEVLNADGTIPSNLLTTIHGENSEWANNSIGLLNDFSITEKGIALNSQIDGNYQLKINSLGIFITENALRNSEWMTAISAKGINADVIKTGHLLTNKVSILSDGQPAQIWDDLGISMYGAEGYSSSPEIDEHNFVRLDQYGLYFVENSNQFGRSGGSPWFKSLSYNDAVSLIRDNSQVSITKLGFEYNVSKEGVSITIGRLPGSNLHGIKFTKDNDVIFEVNSDGNAKIAGFNFDNNKFWYNQNSIEAAYKNDNSFCLIPSKGLSMKNIKLETSGLATFGNILLTGGYIGGGDNTQTVTIKRAMLGPFAVWRASSNKKGNWEDDYLYAELNSNGESIDFSKTNKWAWYGISGNGKALLNRKNKIYLGDLKLTNNILASSGFPTSISNKLAKDTGGFVLSVGDVFWVHSSGYGYAGGNFYFNGTLYANHIDANSISVNGEDVMSTIRNNDAQVVNIINNYLGGGNGRAVYVNRDKQITGITSVTLDCRSAIGHGDFTISGPALQLKTEEVDYYLILHQGLLCLASKGRVDNKYVVRNITGIGELL